MTAFNAKPHEVRAMLSWGEFCAVSPLKPQPYANYEYAGMGESCTWFRRARDKIAIDLPFTPGEHVVVKEACCPVDDRSEGGKFWIDYRATPRWSAEKPTGWDQAPDDPDAMKWRGPQNMRPEWSRLTLEVLRNGVSVKRVQDVTEEEARLSGMQVIPNAGVDLATGAAVPAHRIMLPNGREIGGTVSARRVYADAWPHFHPKTPWDANPWVCVARAKVHHCNIKDVKGEAA